jgi:hypothetical protein
MRKKNISCFIVLLHCTSLLPSAEAATIPPFFSNTLTTHLYFGEDLNNLSTPAFQGYSLFQYIDDFGIQISKESSQRKHTACVTAKARIKGIFGNNGSGLVPWQEEKKFQIWMREASLLYASTENKTSFFQLGIFPFKVGNGFVLGNAYNINIPISWQYLYEQIDQFRPGVLIHLSNHKKSISGDAYVAMTNSQNNLTAAASSTFTKHLIDLTDGQTNGKSVLAVFQINFDPLENHSLQITPSLFFQKDTQFVEFPNDATSILCTPSLYGVYQRGDLKISFEYAKNLGQQKVTALDRTVIITPSLADELFIFDNAYNRYRKGYAASYQGFLAYLDFILTKETITWGVAATYASGANDPNDTHETVLLTRFTPGVQYKDHNKKYKGFIGTDQLYETPALNNLYFGAGDFSYSNLAFFGSTLQYTKARDQNTLNAQATVVSYFKPFAPILDITNQEGVKTTTLMSHYLGTEINWSGSYSLAHDVTFSLMGGVFFAGKFYKELKQEFITLQNDISRFLELSTVRSQTTPSPLKVNHCYFVSAAVMWQFDSSDIKKLFETPAPALRNHHV